ncbi:death-on-curing protein [Asticcacaulis sp.]|uniref:type II toxin-antitoxin system death-on-curing family toxin n=1 Tax=Asticcacaulis sp. TaxID=1872648 RepID=UPI002CACB526|nr:death-on-curing protein [Asticcacaulis sp.]HTM81115.1 death-on-curing protein [Asticcacaulis sp.]
MPFVLIREGLIEAIQAEQVAEHGGQAGLRELSPMKMMHARVRALNESASTDLASLAACYGYVLAHDQLFHDANLSTALITTELFLSLNGYRLSADDTTCFLGFTVVGNGELSGEAFASWIRGHITPQSLPTAA